MAGAKELERKALAQAIKQRVADMDDDPDLSFKILSNMSVDELVSYAARRGIIIDVEKIWDRVQLDFGTDLAALDRGVEMDPHRIELLEAKIMTAVETTARLAVKEVIRNTRMDLLKKAAGEEDFDAWIWIANLRNSCASCEGRHGQIFTMEQWQRAGLPGSQSLLCGEECQCTIMPYPAKSRADTQRLIRPL